MTFSIAARSTDGTQLGVAVASKFLAVGAAVPAAASGVGAIATQAVANLAYRPRGLALLAAGADAASTVAALVAADPASASRQVGVVATTGDGAGFTGADCHDWAGGLSGDGYAIQGNVLVGPEVLEALREAFTTSDPGAPLARRLLAALAAGDAAGGDRRGRQSAALQVVTPGGGYGGGSDQLVDLRTDDHPDPLAELARLLDLHHLYFGRPDPDTLLPLTGNLSREVAALLAGRGYPGPDVEHDLASWAGVENVEERLVPGSIDPVVLALLRAR